jgi:hypothetical protein
MGRGLLFIQLSLTLIPSPRGRGKRAEARSRAHLFTWRYAASDAASTTTPGPMVVDRVSFFI